MIIFAKWISWCLLSVCVLEICSAALPTSGAHELDEFASHDQQALVSNPSKPSPLHANRVFNRAVRGPQPNVAVPRSNSQQKVQTTQSKSTSTLPPTQQSNEENEEIAVELETDGGSSSVQPKEQEPSFTTSSTEALRKGFAGTVRPFRSNKDLLDSLKRRRQMIQQHGYTVVPPTSASTTEKQPLKNSQTTRKVGNLNKSSGQHSDSAGYQKKSTTPSRRHNVKVTPSTTPLNDAITEESNAVSQPSRSSRTYPKTRRIS